MSPHATTMPVYEVMTRAPVTVTPSTTVAELMTLFDRHDFNAFPVLDAKGVVSGIVTKLDVLRMLRPDQNLAVPGFATLGSGRVGDIMRRGVVCVEAEDPVVVAADLMVETRLHSLPVVRRNGGGPKLMGIVSRGDLLRGLRFEFLGAQAVPVGSQG